MCEKDTKPKTPCPLEDNPYTKWEPSVILETLRGPDPQFGSEIDIDDPDFDRDRAAEIYSARVLGTMKEFLDEPEASRDFYVPRLDAMTRAADGKLRTSMSMLLAEAGVLADQSFMQQLGETTVPVMFAGDTLTVEVSPHYAPNSVDTRDASAVIGTYYLFQKNNASV